MGLEINFPVNYIRTEKLAKAAPGQCFVYEGQLYIKTSEFKDEEAICVCLHDGSIKNVNPDTYVSFIYLQIKEI